MLHKGALDSFDSLVENLKIDYSNISIESKISILGFTFSYLHDVLNVWFKHLAVVMEVAPKNINVKFF